MLLVSERVLLGPQLEAREAEEVCWEQQPECRVRLAWALRPVIRPEYRGHQCPEAVHDVVLLPSWDERAVAAVHRLPRPTAHRR